MKRALVLALLVVLGPGADWSSAGTIDPVLEARLARLAPDAQVDVLVEMVAAADPHALAAQAPAGRAARGRAVVVGLRAFAARSKAALLASLAWERAAGTVSRIQPFWIANVVSVSATPSAVRAIAARRDVGTVRDDFAISRVPTSPGSAQPAADGVEWNVDRIGAPLVWAAGNRGQGSVVGIIDSGVDAGHPDLASRWLGGWLDAVDGLPSPYDENGHGTHVSGTAVGGNAGGTGIGVAPDAKFFACRAIVPEARFVDVIECAQFMMDPDGDPETSDAPDVVSNSWSMSGAPTLCVPLGRTIVQAWIAAGIVPVFAAGNEGPFPLTGVLPAIWPESFAVGATTILERLARFSSRGPSTCGFTLFPEVSAPGQDIRSAWPGGGYELLDGTSMATPAVSGCIALMRSADPEISVEKIQDILQETAVDRGFPGPDIGFGVGRIDCAAAVERVVELR